MPARIRHFGERFPTVPRKLARNVGVVAGLCWVGLAGLTFFEYLRQGPAGEDPVGAPPRMK